MIGNDLRRVRTRAHGLPLPGALLVLDLLTKP
jgi:hypothetical protein